MFHDPACDMLHSRVHVHHVKIHSFISNGSLFSQRTHVYSIVKNPRSPNMLWVQKKQSILPISRQTRNSVAILYHSISVQLNQCFVYHTALKLWEKRVHTSSRLGTAGECNLFGALARCLHACADPRLCNAYLSS